MNEYVYINKFSPKRLDSLVRYEDIKEELFVIDEAPGYYATKKGKIYHQYTENGFHKIKFYINRRNGYAYVTLSVNGKNKTFRVNRLIAKACIPNPNNFPVVGHSNNVKSDNRAKNLYWTTYSENTQKAVNDKLLINDQGFDDSQSIPVVCLDDDGNVLKVYGSISLAHKELGVSKSTIARQILHTHKSNRCGYYFRSKEEFDEHGFIL